MDTVSKLWRYVWNPENVEDEEEEIDKTHSKQIQNDIPRGKDSVVMDEATEKKFTGTVTGIYSGYGMIDHEVYFAMNCVEEGRKPQLGDTVEVTAVRKHQMGGWRAKSVCVKAVRGETVREEPSWGDGQNEDPTVKENISSVDPFEEEDFKNKHSPDEETVPEKQATVGMITNISRDQGIMNELYAFKLSECLNNFIPCKGDWVGAKLVVDKQTGNTYAFDVKPLREMTFDGVINSTQTGFGYINKDIYFTYNVCEEDYTPRRGDRVCGQAIEVSRGRSTWRALCVNPVQQNLQDRHLSREVLQNPLQMKSLSELLQDKQGIEVTRTIDFGRVPQDKQKDFSVWIRNSGGDLQTLESCRIRGAHTQFYLSTDYSVEEADSGREVTLNRLLSPGASCKVSIMCRASNLGRDAQMLILKFTGFEIGREISVNITAASEHSQQMSLLTGGPQYERRRGWSRYRAAQDDKAESWLIPGERPNNCRPNIQLPNRLPMYPIPAQLRECFLANDNILNLVPELGEDLCLDNYTKKFSTLLHLEEIQEEIDIRDFDMERVCLKPMGGEYLSLKVPGLAEGRPSVLIGDRVILTDPVMPENSPEYEGFIHVITRDEAWLRFNQNFHSQYNGEDYNVRFTFNRTPLRRSHQSAHFAPKLGAQVLFPASLLPKMPQIKAAASSKSSSLNNPGSNNSALSKSPVTKQSPASIGIKRGPPRRRSSHTDSTVSYVNKRLNPRQRAAVLRILQGQGRPTPYILFGPPGTGKTVTLVESILQIFKQIPQSRIIASAPSNSACDLLVERLHDSGCVQQGDLVRLNAFQREEQSIPEVVKPYVCNGDSLELVSRYRILVCTCTSAGMMYSLGLKPAHFTHVFVDESLISSQANSISSQDRRSSEDMEFESEEMSGDMAQSGQATEPESMIPIGLVAGSDGQVVLAGDPMQLGPVLRSGEAKHYGLAVSLLERLIQLPIYSRDENKFSDHGSYDPLLVTKLVENYRSHPALIELPSQLFYHSELLVSADRDMIECMCGWEMLPNQAGFPMIFHGMRGEDLREGNSPSWFNPVEAVQVMKYLQAIVNNTTHPLTYDDIGIITPYRKQVEKIRLLIDRLGMEKVKVGSVEEFQGQERMVIIISTVRSREQHVNLDMRHNLGFLSNEKRFNVAITRGQALLIIIGNPHVLYQDSMWSDLIAYAVYNKAYIGCDLPDMFSAQNEKEPKDAENCEPSMDNNTPTPIDEDTNEVSKSERLLNNVSEIEATAAIAIEQKMDYSSEIKPKDIINDEPNKDNSINTASVICSIDNKLSDVHANESSTEADINTSTENEKSTCERSFNSGTESESEMITKHASSVSGDVIIEEELIGKGGSEDEAIATANTSQAIDSQPSQSYQATGNKPRSRKEARKLSNRSESSEIKPLFSPEEVESIRKTKVMKDKMAEDGSRKESSVSESEAESQFKEHEIEDENQVKDFESEAHIQVKDHESEAESQVTNDMDIFQAKEKKDDHEHFNSSSLSPALDIKSKIATTVSDNSINMNAMDEVSDSSYKLVKANGNNNQESVPSKPQKLEPGLQITALEERVIRQMEYYFGDVNLIKDKFLQEQIKASPDAWVALEVICTFNKMKELTTDFDQICRALDKSPAGLIEVSADRKHVRRSLTQPLIEDHEVWKHKLQNRSIVLEGLSIRENSTMDRLKVQMERKYGRVEHIERGIPKVKENDSRRRSGDVEMVVFSSSVCVQGFPENAYLLGRHVTVYSQDECVHDCVEFFYKKRVLQLNRYLLKPIGRQKKPLPPNKRDNNNSPLQNKPSNNNRKAVNTTKDTTDSPQQPHNNSDQKSNTSNNSYQRNSPLVKVDGEKDWIQLVCDRLPEFDTGKTYKDTPPEKDNTSLDQSTEIHVKVDLGSVDVESDGVSSSDVTPLSIYDNSGRYFIDTSHQASCNDKSIPFGGILSVPEEEDEESSSQYSNHNAELSKNSENNGVGLIDHVSLNTDSTRSSDNVKTSDNGGEYSDELSGGYTGGSGDVSDCNTDTSIGGEWKEHKLLKYLSDDGIKYKKKNKDNDGQTSQNDNTSKTDIKQVPAAAGTKKNNPRAKMWLQAHGLVPSSPGMEAEKENPSSYTSHQSDNAEDSQIHLSDMEKTDIEESSNFLFSPSPIKGGNASSQADESMTRSSTPLKKNSAVMRGVNSDLSCPLSGRGRGTPRVLKESLMLPTSRSAMYTLSEEAAHHGGEVQNSNRDHGSNKTSDDNNKNIPTSKTTTTTTTNVTTEIDEEGNITRLIKYSDQVYVVKEKRAQVLDENGKDVLEHLLNLEKENREDFTKASENEDGVQNKGDNSCPDIMFKRLEINDNDDERCMVESSNDKNLQQLHNMHISEPRTSLFSEYNNKQRDSECYDVLGDENRGDVVNVESCVLDGQSNLQVDLQRSENTHGGFDILVENNNPVTYSDQDNANNKQEQGVCNIENEHIAEQYEDEQYYNSSYYYGDLVQQEADVIIEEECSSEEDCEHFNSQNQVLGRSEPVQTGSDKLLSSVNCISSSNFEQDVIGASESEPVETGYKLQVNHAGDGPVLSGLKPVETASASPITRNEKLNIKNQDELLSGDVDNGANNENWT